MANTHTHTWVRIIKYAFRINWTCERRYIVSQTPCENVLETKILGIANENRRCCPCTQPMQIEWNDWLKTRFDEFPNNLFRWKSISLAKSSCSITMYAREPTFGIFNVQLILKIFDSKSQSPTSDGYWSRETDISMTCTNSLQQWLCQLMVPSYIN